LEQTRPTTDEDVRRDATPVVRRGVLAALWLALRPQQWVKNLLVVAPLLFSENLFNASAFARSAAAFFLFCAASSAGYLINDLRDLERDRLHPFKRRRPLASGRLAPRAALFAALLLLVASLAGSFALSRAFGLVLSLYLLVSLSYTFLLKHLVILDVFAAASGFVLRAVGGALVIQVELSSWLLVCTTLLSLFLGFSKRRYELLLLKEQAGSHRQVLEEYNPRFLDMMIGIVSASTVTSYTLYTVSEETIQRFRTRSLLFTLPFVLYGIFRYLYLVYHKERGGDPIETAFADPAMLVNLLLWASAVVAILYWR
jgi:4-hydroxybenzoate polyprenyltransferase